MAQYNNQSRSGGRPSGGRDFTNRGAGNRPFGGSSRPQSDTPTTYYQAKCDECHKDCEVPFIPSGDKPVYCKSCFNTKKESGFPNSSGRGNTAPVRSNRPAMAPAALVKTVFDNGKGTDELKKQIESLTSKVDRLIQTVEMMSQAYLTGNRGAVDAVTPAPAVRKTAKSKAEVSEKESESSVVAKKALSLAASKLVAKTLGAKASTVKSKAAK